MEYFKTRAYQSSLNFVIEILSATWAFLVWKCPYSMSVMYLLDLVELLLDNTHETKLQAFPKK